MTSGKGDIRLTEHDWVMAALRAMGSAGVDAVSVERLARDLGATKGSFYWHFTDRAALVAAALQLWEENATLSIIERLNHVDDPRQRLQQLFEHSFGAGSHDIDSALVARFDDPVVGPIVNRVTTARIAFVETAYRQMGLPPARAARQARIAYATYVGHFQIRRAAPDDAVIQKMDRAYIRQLLETLLPAPGSRR